MRNPPVRIAITGAAGQIGYNLVSRIAGGAMLGKDQPVILQLLDLPQSQKTLSGVVMELQDCASPLVAGIIATEDPAVAFRDAQFALLVGARPRGPGMERKDLLAANGAIFTAQGEALGRYADPDCKVLVVGNPCNTNALITMTSAMRFGRLKRENFTAMLRLDHNRALAQIACKTERLVGSLSKMIVWGNHSSTMYADYRFCESNGDRVSDLIQDETWYREEFLPTVRNRGAAVIQARGLSSAASAANAALGHVRDWWRGSPADDWVTMGVPSDGAYGVPEGIIFGFPCVTENGRYRIVRDLELDDYSREAIASSAKDLLDERDAIRDLLD